jgi:hypothetical protein
MDLADAYRIMIQKGLINDPAFTDLNFSFEPIPRFDGCPLGLYFPQSEYVPEFGRTIPAKTIILPVEAQEGVLLHELGHRFGEYYYNDLSEEFAEDFRKIYQPRGGLLYSGNDVERISSFSTLFQEGERGAIEIVFDRPLSSSDINELKFELSAYAGNEPVPKVRYTYRGGYPLLRIDFTQGAPWLIIIPGILIFAISAALFYGIYKMFASAPWIVPTAALAFGVFLGLRFLYREAKKS